MLRTTRIVVGLDNFLQFRGEWGNGGQSGGNEEGNGLDSA